MKILEAADDNPDASFEEISSDVNGASASLVEKVLEEYGDPADIDGNGTESATTGIDEESNVANDAASDRGDDPELLPSEINLTKKQEETIQSIYQHPEATQAKLAELLGVSSATICQRVNSIPGFEWSERETFARQAIESGDGIDAEESTRDDPGSGTEQSAESVDPDTSLERHQPRDDQICSVFSDPKLVHKIVYACMEYKHITEEEELRILQQILTNYAVDGE